METILPPSRAKSEPRSHELISILAPLFGGILATYALTSTSIEAWAYVSPPSQLTALTVGAGSAVAVGVAIAARGSSAIGWTAAAVLGTVLALTSMGLSSVTHPLTLSSFVTGRCAIAGALLGALVAAVWGERNGQTALLFGVLGTYLATLVGHGKVVGSWFGDTPFWLFVLVVAISVAALAVSPITVRIHRSHRRAALVTILLAVLWLLLNRVLAEWVSRQGMEVRGTYWLVAVISLLAVFLVVEAMTRWSRSPFTAAAAGVAAAAAPLAANATTQPVLIDAWIVVVTGVAAVGAGLAMSIHWRHPTAGLYLVAAVPIASAGWPEFGTDGPMLAVKVAVLGLGAAHVLGSNLPPAPSVAISGLVLPFSSLVFVAVAGGSPTDRAPGGLVAMLCDVSRCANRVDLSWTGAAPGLDRSLPANGALVVIVILCIWSVTRLLRGTHAPAR